MYTRVHCRFFLSIIGWKDSWVGVPSKTRHRSVWGDRTEIQRVAKCSFEKFVENKVRVVDQQPIKTAEGEEEKKEEKKNVLTNVCHSRFRRNVQ